MKSRLAFLPQHVLPALVCFSAALLLAQWDWIQRIEAITLDARTQLRAAFYPTIGRDELALIGIDEPSLRVPPQGFGRWPWSREVHGDFLQLIGRTRPSVVAWDILFTEPVAEDAHFAKGIRSSRAEVILGAERADADVGIKPSDEPARATRLAEFKHVEGDISQVPGSPAIAMALGELGRLTSVGFTDTPPGPDGVRREAPLLVQVEGRIYPTLSLQSLLKFWHIAPDQVRVRIGDAITLENGFVKRRIPIDATGAYLINYRHALGGFVNYGYKETFDDLYHRFVGKASVPIPQLTGRILLIGQTADGLTDFGPTPFSRLTPLVLVHANVIENVLNEDYARRVPTWPLWLGGLAATVASLGFFANRRFREQTLFSLGVPVAYALVAILCWARFSLWLPLVWPVLAFGSAQVFMMGRRALAEQRAKEQIKGMFGAYVSPELVNQMVNSGVSPQLGGHDEEITAYFSDIQNFSTFSEKLKSGPLVELMNQYLTACTDIVQAEGGTLDKYIGDAVVAMFGAPIPMKDHAYRACVATQRVHLKLAELREHWKGEGDKWPEIVRNMQTRIGLNTGICMIGNMGSRTRFNYTMMGDNVNLAARMESGSKSWGAYTMCTEATKRACEIHGGDRVVFRPLGRIVVKGRSTAVPIYEIVGLKENITDRTCEAIARFEEGLARYYVRDWDGALALFAKSGALEPNQPGQTAGVVTNPSLVYTDITRRYKASPPPDAWDGVYVMKEK